ncbi:uncharacterized protein MONBRDRAFT_13095, partial [Monosiga brevicollis MX1]
MPLELQTVLATCPVLVTAPTTTFETPPTDFAAALDKLVMLHNVVPERQERLTSTNTNIKRRVLALIDALDVVARAGTTDTDTMHRVDTLRQRAQCSDVNASPSAKSLPEAWEQLCQAHEHLSSPKQNGLKELADWRAEHDSEHHDWYLAFVLHETQALLQQLHDMIDWQAKTLSVVTLCKEYASRITQSAVEQIQTLHEEAAELQKKIQATTAFLAFVSDAMRAGIQASLDEEKERLSTLQQQLSKATQVDQVAALAELLHQHFPALLIFLHPEHSALGVHLRKVLGPDLPASLILEAMTEVDQVLTLSCLGQLELHYNQNHKVYKARAALPNRPEQEQDLAVKEYAFAQQHKQNQCRTFLRELRAMRQLEHPNIVPVLGALVGVHDGHPSAYLMCNSTSELYKETRALLATDPKQRPSLFSAGQRVQRLVTTQVVGPAIDVLRDAPELIPEVVELLQQLSADGRGPSNIAVRRVERVQNPVCGNVDALSGCPALLRNTPCQERLLLHGIPPDTMLRDKIVRLGFDYRFAGRSSGHKYGLGVYLADHPGKWQPPPDYEHQNWYLAFVHHESQALLQQLQDMIDWQATTLSILTSCMGHVNSLTQGVDDESVAAHEELTKVETEIQTIIAVLQQLPEDVRPSLEHKLQEKKERLNTLRQQLSDQPHVDHVAELAQLLHQHFPALLVFLHPEQSTMGARLRTVLGPDLPASLILEAMTEVDQGLTLSSLGQLSLQYNQNHKVYKARAALPNLPEQDLAVKEYALAEQHKQDQCRTFLRELRAMRQLEHPHIIPVLGALVDVHSGHPSAYLVQSWCTQGDLQQWLGRARHLATSTVVAGLMNQLRTALAFMHSKGLVHRDVKLSNVMLDGEEDQPVVRLGDFDIAKAAAEATMLPCTATASSGTAGYVAPEVLFGMGRVGARPAQDAFSFGCVLYNTYMFPQTVPPAHPRVDEVVDRCSWSIRAGESDCDFPHLATEHRRKQSNTGLGACRTSTKCTLTVTEWSLELHYNQNHKVYKARAALPNRPEQEQDLAVKEYAFAQQHKQNQCRTFLRELRAMRQLEHPNIVPVLGALVGVHDGHPSAYLVQPWCTQGDLQQWLGKARHLATSTVVASLMTQLRMALAFMHSKGLVHRDVKLSNVMLDGDEDQPVVRLGDFDITKAAAEATMLPCTATESLGTTGYVAPEVLFGQGRVGARSAQDVFSFGCVLYNTYMFPQTVPPARLPTDQLADKCRWDAGAGGAECSFPHLAAEMCNSTSELYKETRALLATDPKQRPSLFSAGQRVQRLVTTQVVGPAIDVLRDAPELIPE